MEPKNKGKGIAWTQHYKHSKAVTKDSHGNPYSSESDSEDDHNPSDRFTMMYNSVKKDKRFVSGSSHTQVTSNHKNHQ